LRLFFGVAKMGYPTDKGNLHGTLLSGEFTAMAYNSLTTKVNVANYLPMTDEPTGVALLRTPGMFSRIARSLGITRQAPSAWRRVPAERVLDVERITNIPRWRLRPDLYPPPHVKGHTYEHTE
jgi:hypothetical protein